MINKELDPCFIVELIVTLEDILKQIEVTVRHDSTVRLESFVISLRTNTLLRSVSAQLGQGILSARRTRCSGSTKVSESHLMIMQLFLRTRSRPRHEVRMNRIVLAFFQKTSHKGFIVRHVIDRFRCSLIWNRFWCWG